MVTAWQQDRRRKQAQQLKSESVAGLEAILGGLGDIDTRQRNDAAMADKRAQADAEAARRERDTASREQAVKERASANVLREKRLATETEAQNTEREARAAVLRRKAASEEQAAARGQLKSRAQGGAGEEDLIKIASADDRLGELDDDAVRAVMREAEDEAKKREADMALSESRRDAVDRSNRPKPAGQGGGEMQDLRRRKLRAEVAQLESDRAGGGKANIARGETKKAQVLEVDNYVANIDRNIEDLKSMIDKVGTTELVGPEQEIMDRKMTEIATDLAKLADPGSVAREGEVALQRSVLIPTGVRGAVMTNETAKAILESLKQDVANRRKTAYRIRGIEAPNNDAPAPAKKPADMSDDEIAARLAQLRGKK